METKDLIINLTRIRNCTIDIKDRDTLTLTIMKLEDSIKEQSIIEREPIEGKEFRCPWCDEIKPLKYQCSKGYCISCSGKDY